MTIQILLQSLANGVSLSVVYILVALGLTLIFSILRVINFAHGEFYMLGGYTAYYLTHATPLPYLISIPLAFIVVGIFGVIVERLFFARLRNRELEGFVASLGLLWILQSAAILLFGAIDREVPGAFEGIFNIFGVIIAKERVFVIVCATLLIIAVYLFLSRSRHGTALRALAQDGDAAALQGIKVDQLSALAFGIGCALAAAAGALLAPVYYVGPTMGTLPVIKAFVIIILGGMGSFGGAVAGGFFLGLLESIAPLYMPIAAVEMMGFVIVMIVLIVRPRGLFGHV